MDKQAAPTSRISQGLPQKEARIERLGSATGKTGRIGAGKGPSILARFKSADVSASGFRTAGGGTSGGAPPVGRAEGWRAFAGRVARRAVGVRGSARSSKRSTTLAMGRGGGGRGFSRASNRVAR